MTDPETVRQIYSETVLDFVRREGPVTTAAVAHRFGMWNVRDARKALKRLEREGLISSKRESFDYCAMNVWSAAP